MISIDRNPPALAAGRFKYTILSIFLASTFFPLAELYSQQPSCEDQRDQTAIHAQIVMRDRSNLESELASALNRLNRLESENERLKKQVKELKDKEDPKKGG